MDTVFDTPQTGTPPVMQTGDPQYQQQAVEGYAARTQPQYTAALKQLRQNYASRGLGESGISGLAELGLNQSHLQDINDFGRQTALTAADMGEQNRRRVQDRGWQVEDRNYHQSALDRLMADQNSRADAQRASQLIGQTAGTVGSAIGAYYGGPGGAAVGGKAGSSLGDLVSGSKNGPPATEAEMLAGLPK